MSGRRWAATLGGVAVAAALTGCGGGDSSDADVLSAEPTRTPLTALTSRELKSYSGTEQTAYKDAVAAIGRGFETSPPRNVSRVS